MDVDSLLPSDVGVGAGFSNGMGPEFRHDVGNEIRTNTKDHGEVLLTGATGFVGRADHVFFSALGACRRQTLRGFDESNSVAMGKVSPRRSFRNLRIGPCHN